MTLLHDFFNLRNQQAFQRLLDDSDRGQANAGLSTGGGKSWNRSSTLTSAMAFDINARDWLGRTVLHLACASPDSIEYVRLLLRHQAINVNLPDIESQWTPLHRALYQANFPAALLLLQRTDMDRSLQDLEGYTAFDLYNSTLNNTKPGRGELSAELYTWGANRNAALGLGDGSDRTYPDQVVIRRREDYPEENESLTARFSPILTRQIQMSKLHTAVVTSESGGNLRVCGFSSGGRLGPGQHTQYSLKAMPQFSHTIVSVALGQDHTLAMTKSGEVLSWGLNRFSQLGYIVESAAAGEGFGRIEEPIQSIPKKIHGPLRKETVRGIAASKGASACWTNADVYTWGTNNGQLGYDKAAQPVQVLPRKATKVTQPVLAISLTDSAMACLLETQDVVCIWNDRQIKISFPGHAFPIEMQPYRPPEAIQDAKIAKITSCEDTFAALSLNGELFTFSIPSVTESDGASGKERPSFKPQRVWALRKKFSAVKDVALGSDGSIIICTESGHVFVRSHNTKAGQTTSGKAFKFQRIPYLQRVTQVCANSTGAFGALRVEYKPQPLDVRGNTIAQDMAEVQPTLSMYCVVEPRKHISRPCRPISPPCHFIPSDTMFDDEADDLSIINDIGKLRRLFDVIALEKKARQESRTPFDIPRLPHDADVIVHGPSGTLFLSHRLVLSIGSPVLREILDGSRIAKDKTSGISLRTLDSKTKIARNGLINLSIIGCHPISILIFLDYVYSDDLLAIWDNRVSTALSEQLRKLKIQPAQIKLELRSFAILLELPYLAHALESPVKRTPAPFMVSAMEHLFETAQGFDNITPESALLAPDVILQLADKNIQCHSIVLRARSAFFADFFDGEDWTTNRWDTNGMIVIDMKHLTWRVMDYVLRFMCCGADAEMFDTIDFINSVDELLEFTFDVMAAANELLLDRLILLCSAVILKNLSLHKACFILSDATYLHAEQLTERVQSYITVNMELFLTTGMLNDISIHLVKDLARFARQKQAEKSPVSRSNRLAVQALEVHADWLALQDIPHVVPRSNAPSRKDSSHFKSSSSGPNKLMVSVGTSESPHHSPNVQSNEDIFTMDDADMVPSVILTPLPTSPTPATHASPVWKAPSMPRVDMKTVMAEAASASTPRPPPGTTTHETSSNILRSNCKPSQTDLRGVGGPGLSPAGLGSSRTAASHWRPAQDTSPRPSAADAESVSASSGISHSKELHFPGLGSSPTPKPRLPQTPPRPSLGSSPGLGPMIMPTRQSTSSSNPYTSTIRRASGKAWNQPPVKPAATPSPPASGMSFVAIQQLQLDQVAGSGKDKRSLREIQEEEKSLQEEADFLTWWTAEEARIKLEAEAAAASQQRRSKQPRRRSGKQPEQLDVPASSKPNRPKRQPRKPIQQVKVIP